MVQNNPCGESKPHPSHVWVYLHPDDGRICSGEMGVGDPVYASAWGANLFEVGMLKVEPGMVEIASSPREEPGVIVAIKADAVWPALPDLRGRQVSRGEVLMASPVRGQPADKAVVLAHITTSKGVEYATGRVLLATCAGGAPVEWDQGRYRNDLNAAIGDLRERSGWTP